MTAPELAVDRHDGRGRMYCRKVGGEPLVPSITNIISTGGDTLHGWYGWEAANATHRAMVAAGAAPLDRAAVRGHADAATRVRDAAAERGDRLHDYADTVAKHYLGRADVSDVQLARDRLRQHGDDDLARQFENWWVRYDVQPIDSEITVWSHRHGYAGTIDLLATINGLKVLVDYKNKRVKDGMGKPVSPSVGMQMIAGLRADEHVSDPHAGTWREWPHGDARLLIGVGISSVDVQSMRVNPDRIDGLWRQFLACRELWQTLAECPTQHVLTALRPPPSAARFDDDELVPLNFATRLADTA